MKIVTDGTHFRIQEDNGEFHKTYVSFTEGRTGSYEPWQTRSYIRALKRYGSIMKARAIPSSVWHPVE